MRRWLILCLALFMLAASGCSLLPKEDTTEPVEPPPQSEDRHPTEPEGNLRETIFYLPDENWQILVPVRIYIPWEEGIARATLGYCTEGKLPLAARNLGFAPLLPGGTEILGMSVRDGLAKVDFSREFLNYPPEHEELLINGLTYTLTEFPTIEQVEILVENRVPELPGESSTAEPFEREFGINLEIDGNIDDFSNTQRITLYYLYAAYDHVFFVPVSRVIKEPSDWLHAVLEELIDGPQPQRNLFSAVPDGVVLERISFEGTKAVIELAGQPLMQGGQDAADRFRQQIALTLTEISGIDEVAILLNGEIPDFGPGIDFPEYFSRPKRWNLIE